MRQKLAVGPGTRRLTRLHRRSTKPPYDPCDRTFARQVREAFERLYADPVAWEELMDERASIDPLSVPRDYLEERERRREAARRNGNDGR